MKKDGVTRRFAMAMVVLLCLAADTGKAAGPLGSASGLRPLEEERQLDIVPEISEADVAYNVGVKFYNGGWGYIQHAVEWFRKAAEGGSVKGQYRMGVAYERGEGVEQDYAEAFKWYSLSARQKHKGGQYGLGRLYANGHGVKRDDAEAAKWFKLAAEQGVVYAQYDLGVLFLEGRGVSRNFREAYFWFSLAATKLDDAMEKRDEAAGHLTEEQLQEIRKRLTAWKPVQPDNESRLTE